MLINKPAFILFTVSLLFSMNCFAVPEIQHWKTENNARVYFVPAPGLPMVDIRVVLDAGSARDGEIPGTAMLTNALLSEGAAGMSAEAISEQLESVGAEFGLASLRDMATLSLRSLTRDDYLASAVKIMNSVITKPDFPQRPFARELSNMKISLRSRQQSPSSIAEEKFYKVLYGSHPYAEPSGGTEESLEQLDMAAVLRFYQQYYVAKNAIVVIVGDVNRDKAEQLSNDVLRGLPQGKPALQLPEAELPTEAFTIRIPFPSTQTHVYSGQLGMSRVDEDYFTLYVANHPFGGSGFTSRLVDVIREQEGLAYSVYSYFSPMRGKGPFMMGLQTRNNQYESAIKLLHEELVRYVSEGPEEEELESSLKNITGGFALKVDSNRKMLSYLAMIGFYDLPLDYLDTFNDNVEKVTSSMIRETLSRRLDPTKLVTIIVGGDG